jgi:hypothetical protein
MRVVVNTLFDRPTVDGKNERDVPSEPVQLEIDKADLDILFKLLAESNLKADSTSAETERKRKRNTEWLTVLNKYISKANGTCVFMYKGHHFSTSNSTKTPNNKQFLLSTYAKCNFSECTCFFHAIVYDNGELNIKFDGHICHILSKQRARPVRELDRAVIAQRLENGSATANQLRLEELGKLTAENLTFGNLNRVGASPSVYRKIQSTALMFDPNVSVSLEKIKEKQVLEINPGISVPGYLQTITVSPLRLVLFKEGALVLWNQVGAQVPVS